MPTVTFASGTFASGTFASGRKVQVPEGTSVFDAATLARATSVECCGIVPACGECRMTVLEGQEHLSAPDELEAGVRAAKRFLPFERLGCMSHVHGDVTVELER
jgi:ferredoxin